MPLKDMTGQTFRRLTVVQRVANRGKRTRWLCRCACGVEVVVDGGALRSNGQVSCGCFAREQHTKHGHARRGNETATYRSWMSMISRCSNVTDAKLASTYHERGIVVCDRWLGESGYTNFLADMGERPIGTSIDRIDNDRGYEPSNCRWATAHEQNHNTRRSKLTIDQRAAIERLAGSGRHPSEIARVYGVSRRYVLRIWQLAVRRG